MCEVGLGPNEETEEGVKATINRPELLPRSEQKDENEDEGLWKVCEFLLQQTEGRSLLQSH